MVYKTKLYRDFDCALDYKLIEPHLKEMGFDEVLITLEPAVYFWTMYAFKTDQLKMIEFRQTHINNLKLTVTGDKNHQWISEADGSVDILVEFLHRLPELDYEDKGLFKKEEL